MKQILVMMAAVVLVGCGKKDEWPEFKTCERCKETDIKYWADVCKHCGKDPDGANGVEKRAELKKIWLEEKSAENENTSVRTESNTDLPEKAIRDKKNYKPENKLFGEDFAKATSIVLSANMITDAGLKEVAKLQQLERLGLSDNKITDAGLNEVAKLQNLEDLFLDDTQITDEGLKEVAKLQKLEWLRLDGTQITDAGLKEVAKLKQLEYLELYRTKVTAEGVAELRKALPNCEILARHLNPPSSP